MSDEFVDAIKAGHTDHVVSLYTADARMMPPNDLTHTGSEEIRNWMKAFHEQFTIEDFAFSTDEIVTAGDWAFRRGSCSMAFRPTARGETMQESGKFIEIWQRQADGTWKLARDIWNSDNPPPSPPQ